MNKVQFMGLWDAYSKLLTPTQQDITNLYFNLDLTLSEIAVEKGISRQAVSDCLNGCRRQLEEYEEKLHLVRIATQYSMHLSMLVTGAEVWAEKLESEHPELKEDLLQLKDILHSNIPEDIKNAD